jgi:hypothetical protein
MGMLYRTDGKVSANPARLLKRKREDNGRILFLDQHAPDEELRLRAVIGAKYASHRPEFDIALHTGMRPSETLQWSRPGFC